MKTVETLFAFVTETEPGIEAIVAMMVDGGQRLPLIFHDIRSMPAYAQCAGAIEESSKIKIKLVKFSNREEVEWKVK